MPELPDREFELLDQQYLRLGIRLRGQARRSLGAQHRLQRGHIVGEKIIGAHRPPENHKLLSLSEPPIMGINSNPSDQPAACGRHVCCGIRQSMPSSR